MWAWARACIGCQTAKIHRHNRAPLHKFERATARFAHVHVDLVEPLPSSREYTHLLTVIDRFTRWPEAIPLAQTDTGVDRPSVCTALGHQVRRTYGYHLRQGATVHVGYLASPSGITGRQNPSYHGLPPPGERPGRKVPPVFEGGITSHVDD